MMFSSVIVFQKVQRRKFIAFQFLTVVDTRQFLSNCSIYVVRNLNLHFSSIRLFILNGLLRLGRTLDVILLERFRVNYIFVKRIIRERLHIFRIQFRLRVFLRLGYFLEPEVILKQGCFLRISLLHCLLIVRNR